MATRRIVKSSIDWAALRPRMYTEQMPKVLALKSKTETYAANVNAYPATLPAIDFSKYKGQVKIPGMVEQFQKQYESLTIPYPKDMYTAKIEEKCKQTEKEIAEFSDETKKNMKEAQIRYEELDALIDFRDMTIEEVMECFPDHVVDYQNSMYPHTKEANTLYPIELGQVDPDEEEDH